MSGVSSGASDVVRGVTLADFATSQDIQVETATPDKVKKFVLISQYKGEVSSPKPAWPIYYCPLQLTDLSAVRE